MNEGIVFDRVGFRYPAGKAMVLHDVRLAIRPGQVIALVGENGSGKTTLVKLLCRLYDPTAGAITLDPQGREGNEAELQRLADVLRHPRSAYRQFAGPQGNRLAAQ